MDVLQTRHKAETSKLLKGWKSWKIHHRVEIASRNRIFHLLAGRPWRRADPVGSERGEDINAFAIAANDERPTRTNHDTDHEAMRAQGQGLVRQTAVAGARSPTAVRSRAARTMVGGRNHPRSALSVETRQRGQNLVAFAMEEESGSIVDTVVEYVKTKRADYEEAGTPFQDQTFVSKVQPPAGVSTPSSKPFMPTLNNGFTIKAERWNSRASMFGFMSLLLVELIAHKGLLELVGLNVGNGLGFEF